MRCCLRSDSDLFYLKVVDIVRLLLLYINPPNPRCDAVKATAEVDLSNNALDKVTSFKLYTSRRLQLKPRLSQLDMPATRATTKTNDNLSEPMNGHK